MATKKTAEGSAKVAAKTAPKRKVIAKPAAARVTKPAAPIKKAKAAPRSKKVSTQIPQEVIALRAYFIGEARVRAGQPGDSLGDWIEAERQIVAEAGR